MKVIWARIGNATTRQMVDVIRARFPLVQHFMDESDAAFLELEAPNEFLRKRNLCSTWRLCDRPRCPHRPPCMR